MRRALLLALALGACGPEKGTIGAVLAQDPRGHLVVHDAPKGLGAEKQGLEAGDQILTIDGMDVRMLDQKRVHQVLSGAVDEPVKLTVLRGEEVIRVTIKRTPAKRIKAAP